MRHDLRKTVELPAFESIDDLCRDDPEGVYTYRTEQPEDERTEEGTAS